MRRSSSQQTSGVSRGFS